jgi:sortase A
MGFGEAKQSEPDHADRDIVVYAWASAPEKIFPPQQKYLPMVYKVPYKYIKDESFDPIYKTYNRHFVLGPRLLPSALIFVGLGLFVWQVVLPFVYIKNNNADAKAVKGSVLGLASGFSDFNFDELQGYGPAKDTVSSDRQEKNRDANIPQYFYLTIKKLRIEKALVETNADHLNPDEALGHYPNSALPGEPGNTFIFGHSVLPMFYNPKNYKTIFSTIDRLEAGDEIIVEYNNLKYKYLVESRQIKKPVDVDPLAEFKPKYLNEPTITLMTCYPAGSKVMRLLVRGVLSG